MKKENYIIKIYQKFNIYAALIIGILEIVKYKSMGEEMYAFQLKLDRLSLILILILQILTLEMAYPLFKKTKDRDIRFHKGKKLKLEIDQKRIHWFIFVLLIANIYATVVWGNATVGRVATSSFASLFNIIQVRPLFYIYYVCARDVNKKVYWTNSILFLTYRILCGWTGDIMTIIFIELFLRVKYKQTGRVLNAFLHFNDLLVIVGFAIGSGLYCFLQPIKTSIRSGLKIGSLPTLEYLDGVNKLLSRFTNYPASVVAVQNHSIMAAIYNTQGKTFWEVMSVFSPLLPRFIMKEKEFRTFSNIVSYSFIPTLGKTTGTGYNVFIYWFNILESSILCFIVGIICLIIFSIITKKIIYSFDDGSKDVDILYFMFIYGFLLSGQMMGSFGYGYFAMILSIPFLLIFKVVRIREKDYEEAEISYSFRRKKSKVCIRI